MGIYADYPIFKEIIPNGDRDHDKKILEEIKDKFIELEKNFILVPYKNFINTSIEYIEITISNLDGFIQILALCTRGLYEIHLIIRYTKISSDKLGNWIKEQYTDEKEILNTFIKLVELEGNPSYFLDLKQNIIEHQKKQANLLKNHSIPGKNIHIRRIAKELGKTDMHNTLHKLFSKYLHPTSFFINSPSETKKAPPVYNTFISHICLFSYDIIKNVPIIQKDSCQIAP